MNLTERLEKGRKRERTVWARFQGIDVELIYVDLEGLNRCLERAKKTTWVKHQPVREVDTEALADEIGRLIKDWKGFDLATAAGMLPIEVEAGEDLTAEVPCTAENKRAMLLGCYGFADWVQATVTDLAVFRAGELEAEKKT